jgi:hypothetical protein
MAGLGSVTDGKVIIVMTENGIIVSETNFAAEKTGWDSAQTNAY